MFLRKCLDSTVYKYFRVAFTEMNTLLKLTSGIISDVRLTKQKVTVTNWTAKVTVTFIISLILWG